MSEAAAKKARTANAAKAHNPAKAASPVSAPPSAAPGAASSPAPAAAPQAQAPVPQAPVSLTTMLEMDSVVGQDLHLTDWVAKTKAHVDAALLAFLGARQDKAPFEVPRDLALVPALEITCAASGASSFREVMDYDHLMLSFSKNGQYEAAGTIWMLDPRACTDTDVASMTQLESAMWLWSEEALLMSSKQPLARRYSFDVPLPAHVVDTNVAQRARVGHPSVIMGQPLPLLAGRAVVVAWYAAMADALATNENRVFKLLEAALSVPIRLRLSPDADACRLASLSFSESMFASSAASGADSFWRFAEKAATLSGVAQAIATNMSIPKLTAAIKSYGLTFKGKAIQEQAAKGLKNLATFVGDENCRVAYSLMEAFCPELRETTLLTRIAQLCLARFPVPASARASLVLVFDCLRVFRLTGDCPKNEAYTVSKVTGQEKIHQPRSMTSLRNTASSSSSCTRLSWSTSLSPTWLRFLERPCLS